MGGKELLTLFMVVVVVGANRPHPLPLFFFATSTNVGISPQNFLTFSFNPFTTLVWNFRTITSVSPKLLNLNLDHPSKKWFFWSNPYKIEVKNNFSHRTARVTKLWSHDHIYNIIWVTGSNYVDDVIGRNYDVITFNSKQLYFENTSSSNFCRHHQNSNHVY